MKNKILTLITIVIVLIGCHKQPKESTDPQVKAQFEAADKKISEYLDLLDDPNASKDEQKKVLCQDYPETYKKDYMPTLLKTPDVNYTEEKLLSDLKIATDYYKEKLGIQCD